MIVEEGRPRIVTHKGMLRKAIRRTHTYAELLVLDQQLGPYKDYITPNPNPSPVDSMQQPFVAISNTDGSQPEPQTQQPADKVAEQTDNQPQNEGGNTLLIGTRY